MKSEGWDYIFEDSPSFPVKVNNTLDRQATLHEANGWMDPIENIPTGDQSDNGTCQRTIYTETPVFTVTTDTFPARASWERQPGDGDPDDPDTIFVIIYE
jgi:hypothetical protein